MATSSGSSRAGLVIHAAYGRIELDVRHRAVTPAAQTRIDAREFQGQATPVAPA
jgi:hypothetical protein